MSIALTDLIVNKGSNITISANTTLSSASLPAATYLNKDSLASYLIPQFGIIMWYKVGGTVPSGWAVCDGTNNTPDMRSRFVISYGYTYSHKTIGGSTTTTMASSNLPSHTHTGTLDASGSHSHGSNTTVSGAHNHTQQLGRLGNAAPTGYGAGGWGTLNGFLPPADNGGVGTYYNLDSTDSAHVHSITPDTGHIHTFTTDGVGSTTPIPITPPWYSLVYIMKL